MKKTLLLFFAASMVVVSCKKKGCMDETAVNYDSEAKKEDVCNYTPSISLNGANPDSIEIGTAYTDPGATATNVDGSTVAVTIDNSALNVDSIGSYIINYSATNDHGTVSTERTVVVSAGQSSWLGTWTVTSDCSATEFPVAADPVITAGTASNQLVIDNFLNLVGGTANATIDGLSITVPQQTINIQLGDVNFSGTGTMNSSLDQFTIDYDYENTAPFIGGTGSCSVTYDM
jgi:hypothetical protein